MIKGEVSFPAETTPAAHGESATPSDARSRIEPSSLGAFRGGSSPAASSSRKGGNGALANARTVSIARAGVIAAVYASATLIALLFLQGLAWGPVQCRVSEAVCAVAVLSSAAVPGLSIGCVIANLINVAISGTGVLGFLDVVFGSLATLLGALWCRKFRTRPAVALFGFVLANALIVPAYLPIMLQGLGYYAIPFTSIALDGMYLPMYLFGVVAVGLGEALVMYVLGLPLLRAARRFGLGRDEE